MKIKLADYVWNYIEQLGVRHVFMFPGGGAMHLVDSLGKNKSLEYVTLMHEQACVMAAETYARIDYGIGAALVTTGPGGTNAVTGVAAAWLESTPLIVISGQVKTSDLKGHTGVRQRGNQEIGIVDIVNSITKYAVTVKEANDILYYLQKATYEATQGRPGPVWIDIPLDIQAAIIETENLRQFEAEKNTYLNASLNEKIENTMQLLMKAKRPVFIVGQGLERRNGKELFRKLVNTLNIPVLTSWIGVEILPYSHEMNMGKPGMVATRYSNFVMQNADLIIAVGTRLDPAMIGYDDERFAPKAKKVIVDIDEFEVNKFSFPIDIKIVADATEFIDGILKFNTLSKQSLNINEWISICNDWKKKYPLIQESHKHEEAGVNPYYFIDFLSNELADNDIIIPGSSGAGIDIFWLAIKNREHQRLLATGSLGSMGYGIPASIGACLAADRRTICIEGDGSIQLNIQELASIKGMNLPIKIFVLNNGGYLSIMNMQKNHFEGRLVGAERNSHLYLPNITEIAKAYGFNTYEIYSHSEVSETVKAVLSCEGPALCNVFIDQNCDIMPKVMSKVNNDGSMSSGKLENLWPFLSDVELNENIL